MGIEIIMRKEEEKGVSETVLLSLSEVDIGQKCSPMKKYIFPGLEIQQMEQTVLKAGMTVPMSRPEFLALCYLAEHPGWICAKEQIYEAVYNDEKIGDVENSIYCLIHSLRKKLETDPHHPKYIQTVRGVGYKFTIPEN